jgi:hypothetical protein
MELANLYQTGELTKLVAVAKQTDLTLDMVRGLRLHSRPAIKLLGAPPSA